MYRSRIIIVTLLTICCSNSIFAAESNSSDDCIITESDEPSGRHLNDNINVDIFDNTSRSVCSIISKSQITPISQQIQKVIPIKKSQTKKSVLIAIHHVICVYRE